MRKVLSVSSAVAALVLAAGAGPVHAQGNLNARLDGEYAFTQSRHCIEVAGTHSFNPSTFQIVSSGPGPFLLRRFAVADRGTIHYGGDGTGTASVLSIQIEGQGGAGSFPIGTAAEITCEINYTVNADGTVDHHADCTSATGTVSGIITERRIVQGNTAVLHGPADRPVIEKGHFPGSFFPDRERICVRSGISSKIAPR